MNVAVTAGTAGPSAGNGSAGVKLGMRRLDRVVNWGRDMTESAPSAGGIFVSYRRDDAAYPAGWLVDRLVGRFGAGRVFKDVDSIQPGDDFVEDIMAAVGSCAVLLAVIGRKWLTVTDEEGHRRIDGPGDYVRLEIEAALARNVRIVPVLVDGARMPSVADLPASLQSMARRQAVELSPAHFDTSRLLAALESSLSETAPAGAANAGKAPFKTPDSPPAAVVRRPLRGTRDAASSKAADTPSAPIRTLTSQSIGGIGALSFSPDSRVLALAGHDRAWGGKVWLWDPASGRHLGTLDGHPHPVNGLAFSPDGRLLATSADGDRTVRLWDPATGRQIRSLDGHPFGVEAIAFSGNGRVLITCCYNNTVWIWDAATGQARGNSKLAAPGSKAVAVMKRATGRKLYPGGWAFSADGRVLATCGSDGKVQIWDPSAGQNERTLERASTKYGKLLNTQCLSPDGKQLAIADMDHTQVWNPATGRVLRTLGNRAGGVSTSQVYAVAFSSDGHLLATGDFDGNARVWDLTSGRLMHTFKSEPRPDALWGIHVSCVAFSPDGRLLASGEYDGDRDMPDDDDETNVAPNEPLAWVQLWG
jgi:sugar lactone lactonase YvrE